MVRIGLWSECSKGTSCWLEVVIWRHASRWSTICIWVSSWGMEECTVWLFAATRHGSKPTRSIRIGTAVSRASSSSTSSSSTTTSITTSTATTTAKTTSTSVIAAISTISWLRGLLPVLRLCHDSWLRTPKWCLHFYEN